MPTEQYAHAPEILEHCQRIGKQYGLYDNALFHTEVTGLEWDEAREPVDRPDQPGRRVHRAVRRHGHRAAARAEAARHPRHRDVQRPLVPHQPVGLRLHRRRPGRRADGPASPTSASRSSAPARPRCSASRTWPRACRELFVFQRTPSSVDVRGQPADGSGLVRRGRDARLAGPLAGQLRRQHVRRRAARRGPGQRRLDRPGQADPRQAVGAALEPGRASQDLLADFENADHEKMSEIRARVDAIVEDPATAARAQGLVPAAVQAAVLPRRVPAAPSTCRRCTWSTPTAREWSGSPPAGVVAAGVEYPVDCIIYASGFEVGTEPTRRYGFDLTGRDGVRLSEYWSDGMRSMHGIHVHGFPNAFLVQLGQGANFVANVPHNLTDAAKTVAAIVGHMTRRRLRPRSRSARRPRTPGSSSWRRIRSWRRSWPTARPATTTTRVRARARTRCWSGYSAGAPAYFRYIEPVAQVRRVRGPGVQPDRPIRLRASSASRARSPTRSAADRTSVMRSIAWLAQAGTGGRSPRLTAS